ncbi:MAG: hypothetical protein RL026_2259 [Pseudomonadota bacterium]|jgi:predicted DNA-binding transcriptional regulator YafY
MPRLEQAQALLDVLTRSREARSQEALCAGLGWSPATFKRYVKLLREERGLDIQFDREREGYVLKSAGRRASSVNVMLPSGAEVAALLEVEAILSNIPTQLLHQNTANFVAGLQQLRRQQLGQLADKDRVRIRRSHARLSGNEGFAVVLAALQGRKRLQFEYHSRSHDGAGTRLCSPVRLTAYRSNWYLAAWCHTREALRIFSLDRMKKVRIVMERAFEPPPETVAAELDSSYGIFTGKAVARARLRFTPLAARWVAEEEWHPEATLQRLPDGGVVLEVPYHHDTELLMEILRYGAQCEVLSPAPLRRSVADALREASALYR